MSAENIGVFGYYGNANTGDEAILAVIVQEFRKRQRADQLNVFSSDPKQTTSMHGVTAFHAALPESPKDWIVRTLGRNRKQFLSSVQAYKSLDRVIFGGGGLLFDRPDGNPWLLRDLDRLERLQASGVKTSVFAVGIGPLHLAHSKQRVAEVLSKLHSISVRDPQSKSLLEECGVNPDRIHLGSDLVWGLEQDTSISLSSLELPQRHPHRPLMIACLRGEHQSNSHWLWGWVKLLDQLIESLDCDVWLLPMQTGGGCDDREGQDAVHAAVKHQEHITSIRQVYSPQEILAILSSADYTFAERLHGAILSMLAGIPSLGLAYMPKVTRAFQELGLGEFCVSAEPGWEQKLFTAFNQLRAKHQDVVTSIRSQKKDLAKQARSHFDHLLK